MNPAQLKEIMKDPAKMEEGMKKMFDALAKGKDFIEPEILKEQLKQRATALGFPPAEPPKERVEELKKIADPNGTGKVDFNGFKAVQLHMMKKNKEMMSDPEKLHAETKRIFEQLDAEKQGFLSIPKMEELDKKIDQLGVPIMIKLSQEQKDAMKKIGDPDNTGKLTLEGCLKIADAMVAKMKEDGLL